MSEIIAEPPPSRRLWSLSAAAALAIHLGCVALAVAHMQTDEAAKPTTASQESAASEATAMPSVENTQESERSVAPQQGTGESARRIRATWQKELVAHLDKHKRYPPEHIQKNVEIVVNFVLDRLGHVVSATIVKGSGDPVFDNAAL